MTIGLVSLNVVTYNPLAITLSDEYIVVYNVYSTLLTWDGNFHIQGDLAYNWTRSSDLKTWTFQLVKNAYFTDPTNPSDRSHQVTSADVLFSFQLNQQLNASIQHSYATPIAKISAPDPYTVVLQTDQPFAAMYSTASEITILPKYVWQSINNPVHYANSNPIGSGAMYYDTPNATFGSNMILRRNPNYYGPTYYCQFSRPDQIFFKEYTSAAPMVNDFKSGTSGLDAIMTVDAPSYTSAFNGQANMNKWAVDTGYVGEISINVITPQIRQSNSQFKSGSNNPLLLNYTVRSAIAMSINKSALVADALLGFGNVADTLIPDSNAWHYSIPASEQYHFNPKAARALLNSYGWQYDANGNKALGATPLYQLVNGAPVNPLAFRFYTLNTLPQYQVDATDIQGWLAQTGIQTLNGQNKPGYSLYTESQMVGKWFTADYDMWMWDWIFAPYLDPSLDIMEVETTQAIGPTADNFWSNSTYDGIYNQSLITMDPTARRQLTDTLQKMVYDYRSYILPYYRLDLYAATNGRPTSFTSGWTNYGNWTQSPGLTPDSGFPALWFQVQPLDNRPPTIANFPAVSYYNTLPSTISVSASDPENDIQTYSWNFGDGSFANTTGPSVPHTYANVGTYTVQVRVSDSEWPACASTTVKILQYTPGQNVPPTASVIVPTLSNGSYGLANVSQKFDINVSDPDNDPINVSWNFGDGKTGTSRVTGTSTPKDVSVTHAYAAAGTFTVTASVTDNQTGGPVPHVVNQTLSVVIKYPTGAGAGGGNQGAAANPWINYGVPLAIVAAVILAAVAVLLRRRKAAREEERQQGGPPQGPPGPPPPP